MDEGWLGVEAVRSEELFVGSVFYDFAVLDDEDWSAWRIVDKREGRGLVIDTYSGLAKRSVGKILSRTQPGMAMALSEAAQ